MGNGITKFDMVADKKKKKNCMVKVLFPIKMMKDILDNTCGVDILKIIFVVVIEGSRWKNLFSIVNLIIWFFNITRFFF
jgi:hypothetical protein